MVTAWEDLCLLAVFCTGHNVSNDSSTMSLGKLEISIFWRESNIGLPLRDDQRASRFNLVVAVLGFFQPPTGDPTGVPGGFAVASKTPLFTVVPPASRNTRIKTAFSLHRDRWDDYGYKTQYELFYHTNGEQTYIGSVKILQNDQGKTSKGILKDGLLSRLPLGFCSLGQNLDYYERLAELPQELREPVVIALRDVVYRPRLSTPFRAQSGWEVSVVRYIPDFNSFIGTASVLLSKNYQELRNGTLDLRFRPRGWKKSFVLKFNSTNMSTQGLEDAQSSYELPKRIAVLIGRNGSGKSTLLARLARVAHASERARRRDPIRKLGTLTPNGIGFTRIIAISYSAFDSFQIPGVTVEERRQIARDVTEGTGRYIFCGLRDIAAELQSMLDVASDTDLKKIVNEDDLAKATLLKPIEQLANEFGRTLERIKDNGRWAMLEEALEPLLADPSFDRQEGESLSDVFGEDAVDTFWRWSTGHKIVMQIVTSLVAYTQPKSIVLLDEPEMHLHPPMLAALMHSVRIILEQLDASAVVSTHSPVVAQESLSQDVNILRRLGNEVTIASPRIETFGESIGELTDEIFGLNSEVTDYHEILKSLAEKFKTLKGVDSQFEYGLSLQARAYVMSFLATEDDD
jgi:ABC-type lipoprotein export system ATPase subunit